MKDIKVIIIVICSLWFASFLYNNFFLKSMIVGEYVNRNYDYKPVIPEIPYEQDTLRLFDNNQFASRFWGKGTYKIFYTGAGTRLELSYHDEYGKGGFNSPVTRLSFGRPIIWLDRDHNHYLEKVIKN